MKKLLFSSLMAIIAIGFFSCSKDRETLEIITDAQSVAQSASRSVTATCYRTELPTATEVSAEYQAATMFAPHRINLTILYACAVPDSLNPLLKISYQVTKRKKVNNQIVLTTATRVASIPAPSSENVATTTLSFSAEEFPVTIKKVTGGMLAENGCIFSPTYSEDIVISLPAPLNL